MEQLTKIFSFLVVVIIAIYLLEFFLLPKQEAVFTVLWSRVEVHGNIKKKKTCFVKYSTGYNASGRWVEETFRYPFCKKIESGKTYKVKESAIFGVWYINSIKEVR